MPQPSLARVLLLAALFQFQAAAALTPGPEGSNQPILYKRTADIDRLDPAIEAIYPVIIDVWHVCAPGVIPVITSGRDSADEHRFGSFHVTGKGQAVDVRGKLFDAAGVACISHEMTERLVAFTNLGRYRVRWEAKDGFKSDTAHWHFDVVPVGTSVPRKPSP